MHAVASLAAMFITPRRLLLVLVASRVLPIVSTVLEVAVLLESLTGFFDSFSCWWMFLLVKSKPAFTGWTAD